MNSMRILVVSELYPPLINGGYELFASEMANMLSERGFTVSVLTSRPEPGRKLTDPDPSWLYRILNKIGFTPQDFAHRYLRTIAQRACIHHRNFKETAAFLKEHGPIDLAVCFRCEDVTIAPLEALRQARIPLLLVVGDQWVENARLYHSVRGFTRLRRLAATAGKNFLSIPVELYASTSRNITEALKRSGVAAADIVEIATLTDLTRCTPQQQGSFPDVVRLIHGGRLCADKGTDTYVEIVRELSNRRPGLRIEASLYGPAEPGFMASLRKRVKESGLEKIFHFGAMLPESEFLKEMSSNDIFVFPFRWDEPYGRAPLQAMACGAVPVCTRKAGPAETIVHDATGVLVSSYQPEDFAHAILELIDNPERYQRIRQKGIAYSHAAFNPKTMGDTYAAVVEDSLQRWQKRGHQ